MLTFKHRAKSIKTIFVYLLLILVSWSLIGCSDNLENNNISDRSGVENKTQPNRLEEIAPPAIINELDTILSKYQPQVSILTPQPDQVFTENTVTVKLQVQDLPIFRDSQLNLGPHLQLILDNDRYLSIYDLNEPIVLEDLTPGTHTLRVFAVKPWLESFKNEGAYAQIPFHIYTQTGYTPDTSLPLLTYNSPQGTYGAEPIMLDFYLTNAPLHFVAKQNPNDNISDWRIRVTINDESFLLDSWKPVYLKGFQPGINWVKLEFIDDQGEKIENLFNTSVQLVNYQPNQEDNLSKLIKGEFSLNTAQSIVDPDHQITTETPTEETEIQTPEEEIIPTQETETQTPEEETPTQETETQTLEEETPTQETETQTLEEIIPTQETETQTPEEETPTTKSQTEVIPLKFNEEIQIEQLKNSQLLEKIFQQLEKFGN